MERTGVHHVRQLLRSALMETGSSKSAHATEMGVINGSAFTTKGTLRIASYTRAASIPGLAMAFDVSIHSMRMGNGSPTSMARRRASDEACVVNSSQSSPKAYFMVSFFLRHSSGITGSVKGRFVAL